MDGALKTTKTGATVLPPGTEVVGPQPRALVALALEQKADPAVLAQLLEVQQKWETMQAKKAFDAAMAAFKAECPASLPKNKHVSYPGKGGRVDYWHTTLDKIVEVVQPLLAKQGLSHSWRTGFEARSVKVTCRISHRDGHYEETSLAGEPDASGGKNPVQTIGSTTTYLQRYTLLAILGLSTYEEEDTDGRPPTNGQRQEPRQPQPQQPVEEPSALVLERLKACYATARLLGEQLSGKRGEKARYIAKEVEKAFVRLSEHRLSAKYAGALYGNVQDGLKSLGWKRPAEWDEAKKERQAAKKAAQEELPEEPCDPETGEVPEPPLPEDELPDLRQPGEDED